MVDPFGVGDSLILYPQAYAYGYSRISPSGKKAKVTKLDNFHAKLRRSGGMRVYF